MPRASAPGHSILVLLTLLLSSCSPESRPEERAATRAANERILVVASIAPLASLSRDVCGERCHVVTLVPPGASAHTWEPSPRDAERLARADLFFKVGLGYEAWLSKVVGGGELRFLTVDGSEGVDVILDGEARAHGPAPSSEPSAASPRATTGAIDSSGRGLPRNGGRRGGTTDPSSGANPHYWLDPIAMKGAVSRLAETLARLDPAGARDYRSRAALTNAGLDGLDDEIRERTSRFTIRKMVTFHAAWDYFARRYDLTVLAAIEESPGKEPGPRYVAGIVRLVRENGLRAVFSEPQFPPKAAEAIAAECGVRVIVLDPIGDEGIPARGDYFSLLRYDARVLEEAML